MDNFTYRTTGAIMIMTFWVYFTPLAFKNDTLYPSFTLQDDDVLLQYIYIYIYG